MDTKSKLRYLIVVVFASIVCGCGGGSEKAGPANEATSLYKSISAVLPQSANLSAQTAANNRYLLSLSPAALAKAIRTTLPAGTRIYVLPTFDVTDGKNSFSVAGPIKQYSRPDGITIVDRYAEQYHVSAEATITSSKYGETYYFRPGKVIPASFAALSPTEAVAAAAK